MSFRVFFDLSIGLVKAVRVPRGTFAALCEHIATVERTLGLKTEQHQDNLPHWADNDFASVPDDTLCDTAERHNAEVRWLYEGLRIWSKKCAKPSEWLTPAQAATIWHALTMIWVPPERWTKSYYRARMDAVYETLRGRESEGVTIDAKALTPQQADAVITIFAQWLDQWDIRLAVPNGHDDLRTSEDGGYLWCEQCGAVAEEDVSDCRKKHCPIREEEEEEEEEDS